MSFLRHGQIYQSDEGQNRDRRFAPVPAIVSMSLRPAIPWRVGLHQSPPPLRRLLSMLGDVVVGVNHHLMGGGEFSTGYMGNFQPALTALDARGSLTGMRAHLGPLQIWFDCLARRRLVANHVQDKPFLLGAEEGQAGWLSRADPHDTAFQGLLGWGRGVLSRKLLSGVC
jgi:hypothetical protein